MTTTIKVSDETKQLLDMLQARMTLSLRRKKTLTELIDDITRLALKHEDELFKSKGVNPEGKDPPAGKSASGRGRNDAGRKYQDVYMED